MGKELIERIEQLRGKYGISRERSVKHTDDGKYPRHSEPGIVHPINSSVVKVRDNGMIDLFVGTDNGIRIDPRTKTINMIGNIYKDRVGAIQSRVHRDVNYDVGGTWTVKARGDIILETKNTLSFKAKNIVFSDESGTYMM